MQMQNEKTGPAGAYQTLVVIWFALLMSQLLFLPLIYLANPELFAFDLSQPILGDGAPLILLLAAISIVDLGVSFVLKKKHVDRAIAEQKIAFVQTGMIIGCALAEAVSLFGLLAAFALD